MLLQQIPEPIRRRVAAELKIDLKLISLVVGLGETPLQQESRIAKLEVVERYIEQHHEIGSIARPRGYFRGRLDMAWAPVDGGSPNPADGITLFCGYAGTRLVALGGSSAHLLGRSSRAGNTGSHPYAIHAALGSATVGGDTTRLADDLVAVAREIYTAPQPVEFLARRITGAPTHGQSPYTDYILGTPLYVQVVDG